MNDRSSARSKGYDKPEQLSHPPTKTLSATHYKLHIFGTRLCMSGILRIIDTAVRRNPRSGCWQRRTKGCVGRRAKSAPTLFALSNTAGDPRPPL
jgi:hypothetical protein